MARIAINGKFLGAPLNGVHRTAAHYAEAVLRRAGPRHRVRVLAPRAVALPDFPGIVPEAHPGLFGGGQGWEMLTLPRLARGALLLNFCNLAPLLHGNAVVMIHDAQTFLHPDDYSGRQARAYRALLPLVARRARAVLTVSDFARSSLLAHGIGTQGKIEVVHNGTDHILARPPEPGVLERVGVAPGRFALALGSAKGYKNMRRLFSAFEGPDLADLPLVIAGGAPRAAYEDAGWTPPPQARFTGFVSDGELRALYEAAAVFLFPSLTEGFGLPAVEAMHCGCPVIAARAGAMPEVCGAAAILLDPGDTEAWRAAIAALAAGDGRAALVAKGHARAAELTWDRAGDRLWQVIKPLAEG